MAYDNPNPIDPPEDEHEIEMEAREIQRAERIKQQSSPERWVKIQEKLKQLAEEDEEEARIARVAAEMEQAGLSE